VCVCVCESPISSSLFTLFSALLFFFIILFKFRDLFSLLPAFRFSISDIFIFLEQISELFSFYLPPFFPFCLPSCVWDSESSSCFEI
jgi:hypothetical protein